MTIDLLRLRGLLTARVRAIDPYVTYLADPLDKAPEGTDGRVRPDYFLQLFTPYGDELETQLCGGEPLEWIDVQATTVGGDVERMEKARAACRAAFTGWQPDPTTGVMRARPGGIQATDTQMTPPRHYATALWALALT